MGKLSSFQASPSSKRAVAKMQRALRLMGIPAKIQVRDGTVLGGFGLSFDGELIEVRGQDLPPIPVRAYLRGMAPRRTVLWFRREGATPIMGDSCDAGGR